jgi:hypothetical protein
MNTEVAESSCGKAYALLILKVYGTEVKRTSEYKN